MIMYYIIMITVYYLVLYFQLNTSHIIEYAKLTT